MKNDKWKNQTIKISNCLNKIHGHVSETTQSEMRYEAFFHKMCKAKVLGQSEVSNILVAMFAYCVADFRKTLS